MRELNIITNIGYHITIEVERSSDIREQLGVINITDKLTQYKINWRELSKNKVLNYKPEGRRNIGRPLTRWEDDFWEEGTDQGPKPYS